MTSIYVGNLPFDATEDKLRELFAAFGAVERVNIVMDRMTNQPRGFAFVEMSDQTAAQAAIDGLNGKDFNGRTLTVNVARPKAEHRPGGGGGGGYGRRDD